MIGSILPTPTWTKQQEMAALNMIIGLPTPTRSNKQQDVAALNMLANLTAPALSNQQQDLAALNMLANITAPASPNQQQEVIALDMLMRGRKPDPALCNAARNIGAQVTADGACLIPNDENPDNAHFNQNGLIGELASLNRGAGIKKSNLIYPELVRINKKHGGLCELICNKILIEGWMDESKKPEFLKKNITLENLNEGKIVKSHLLRVFSLFRRILAFLFRIYPDNVCSYKEQKKLTVKQADGSYKINREIFKNKLEGIEVGTILKLEIISRSIFSFSGHSTLLKKDSDDSYTYFDPDYGTTTKLKIEDLCQKMNFSLEMNTNASEIYMMKADNFLKRLEKKKLI